MAIKYEIRKMKDVRITDKGIIFLYTFGRYKWLTYEQAVALQQKYEVCKSQLFPNERLVCF